MSDVNGLLSGLKMLFKRQSIYLLTGIVVLMLVLSLYQMQDSMDVQHLKSTSYLARMFNPGTSYRETKEPVNVLLLTYMRSGSSLTGDILQHSQGAFYLYEPFRSLGHKDQNEFTIEYPNGTIRKPPFKFSEEANRDLYNWFTCDIENIPTIALVDGFLKKSLKAGMMHVCLSRMQGKLNRTASIRMCARQLTGICESSPFRVIKVIRLMLPDVAELLDQLPNLKIVHLIRDPRATLFSQSHMGKCSERFGGWAGCANTFCNRVENDVLAEERIMKKYPDRIKAVFYEDIAREPIKTSKILYDFIGAEFSKKAEEYIFNITMAGNPNSCAICTTRSNSSEHIDEWKSKMNPEFIKIVNERCNYIINRYGFDNHPVS